MKNDQSITLTKTSLFALLLCLGTLQPARGADVLAHWIGGSGNWADASNWDIGQVPNNAGGTNCDVVINVLPSNATIIIDQSVTINSLSNAETVVIASGTNVISQWMVNAGSIQMTGAVAKLTLSGSIDNLGQMTATTGTLYLTNTTLTCTSATSVVTVNCPGLLTDVSLYARNGAVISFPAATNYVDTGYGETIQASGVGSRIDLSHLLTFDGGDYSATQIEALNGGDVDLGGAVGSQTTLTLDGATSVFGLAEVAKFSGVRLVVTNAGVLTFPASSRITWEGVNTITASGTASKVVHQGVSHIIGPGSVLTITAPDFTNTGYLEVANGGILVFNGRVWFDDSLVVQPSGIVRVGGQLLSDTRDAAHFSAFGTIILDGSAVPLPQGLFFIEAEDFNYNNGQHQTEADIMPYLGGAYAGLGGTEGIDYHQAQVFDVWDYYRAGEGPGVNVNIIADSDISRGAFNMTYDFKVAWNYHGGGSWYNYTRVFPSPGTNFVVLARLASGELPNAVRLDEVTSGAQTTNQVLVKWGEARGPASGSYYTFLFVPLVDDSGKLAEINLAGERTVRLTILTNSNEDLNYLVFMPAYNLANLQLLEAMSRDLGPVAAGFDHNFAFGTIMLTNYTYVRLVDQSRNSAGTNNEAIYVNSLIVPLGTILDLNGLHLYARSAQISGNVIGGTVQQVPDSGPIAMGTATPGTISAAGELDEWTFFGRGGRSVAVIVNPGGSGSPAALPPYLGWAEVRVLDVTNNVLAIGSNTVSGAGQIVALYDVALPEDGTYRVQVHAPAAYPASSGNYVVTVWDVTAHVADLPLNQRRNGSIETPYSVDRWNFSAVAGQQIRFNLISTSAGGIAFELQGPDGWIGFTNLVTSSDLITLPASGAYTLTAHGTGGQYGTAYAFELEETTQTDLALGDVFSGQFVGSGQAEIFRVDVPASNPMRVALNNAGSGNNIEMYLQFGSPPTRGAFGYSFPAPGANQQIVVPNAYAGTWYVLVYGDTITTPGGFTVQATTSGMFLASVTPDHHGRSADAVLALTGAGFDPTTGVELVSSNGTHYGNNAVSVDSFTQLTVTIPSNSVPPGLYTVRALQTDGDVSSLTNAFTMEPGAEARLETRLIVPARLGYHTLATIWVEYQNSGNAAMPSPLLEVGATQNGRPGAWLTLSDHRLVEGFWTSATPEGFANSVQFLASGATPGLLQPGESGRVPVYYAGWEQPWDFSYPLIYFNLGVLTADDTNVVNWADLKTEMKPTTISTEAWDALWPNFVGEVGTTWGDYLRMLDDNASYLGRLGQRVLDVGQLLGFQLLQADGLSPLNTLSSAVDASLETPGLPLLFSRSFPEPMSQRFELGPFGRGWTHDWQYSVQQATDGTVTILGPEGSRRVFQPDSRTAGSYFAQPGDHATLSPLAGGFGLRELQGTLFAFRADGKLDYVEDPNGNRITVSYTGDLLTSLTHSSGQQLAIAYGPGGRVASVTDYLGRQTTYTYDGANEHLLSAQYYDRGTATYAYGTGTTQHALTIASSSCCNRRYFTYDAQGRLSGTYLEGNAEAVTFSSDAGKVTATDALSHASSFFYDHRGLLGKTENALGDAVHLAFDDQFNLASLTDPAGRSYTYGYDPQGNLTRSTDALGHISRFTYQASPNRLATLTDASANVTRYAYDTKGNLQAITYADGSRESWAYDALGNANTWTNRRSRPIGCTYDAAGRITSKTYADSSQVIYVYDSRGNLTNAVTLDPQLSTLNSAAMSYDSNDRLTNILYDSGRFLAFTYDTAGRRASSVDELGHRLDYRYDDAGRLKRISDETGAEVVLYAYDAAGRLSRKTLGNGFYTTYEYDAAGQVLHLVNYRADNSVLSRFDYAYDSRGRRTAMNTLEGNWIYDYDDLDQLTHAVLASTVPDIPNQDLTYVYDSLGNRVRMIENGMTTEYTANILNQYARVGDTNYVFDADGNLIQEVAPSGTTTYTYNDENRLVGVHSNAGDWLYGYDALGNRVMTTDNGIVKQQVIDPIGLGNVVREYDGAGNLAARYAYGLGLLSQTGAGGNLAYYTFDAVGNVHQLVTDAGAIADAYAYTPFGTILRRTESLANPFQFVGESGVMDERTGLHSMRARFYDGRSGHFSSEDPMPNVRTGVNRYIYCSNDPVKYLDPLGLFYSVCIDPPCFSDDPNAPPGARAPSGPDPFGDPGFKDWIRRRYKEELDKKNRQPPPFPLPKTPLKPPTSPSYPPNIPRGYPLEPPPGLPPYMPLPTPPTGPGGGGPITNSLPAAPSDPNQKAGPAGFGSSGFIRPTGALPYRIDFENETDATVPAQQVIITDALSSNLDLAAFQWAEVGWGDQLIVVPPNAQHFETKVPMSYLGVSFEVQVELGLRSGSGQAYAVFHSIEPATSLPPPVQVGFLPPEDGTGRGQGHISYIVNAKTNLLTGAQIRNVALISFDLLPTIATSQKDPNNPAAGTDPAKECLNTIDSGAPTSFVTALPATSPAAFQVQWFGQDDAGGSGVATYDIFVSKDGGSFVPWLERTNGTFAYFLGEQGHTYAFYSVARDNVGNQEPPHSTADTFTLVITNSPPIVLVSPTNQTATPGADIKFGVTAIGTAPLKYQWRFNDTDLINGVRISGATSNILAIAGVQMSDAGSYTVVITNVAGSVTSSPPAVLTVRQPTPPCFVPESIVSHSDGTFQFTLSSEPGSSLEIQASTNLADWVIVTTLTNSTGTIPFTDAATNFSSRFYRARLLP